MHITASVFINDNESGLHADYERWLEELVPFRSRLAGQVTRRKAPATPEAVSNENAGVFSHRNVG